MLAADSNTGQTAPIIVGATPAAVAARAARAGRATGAMFFIVFGAAWLEAWCWFAERAQVWLFAAIAALAVLLLGWAVHVYRQNRGGASETGESEDERKKARRFHMINAAQWLLIVIGINVLNNTGLGHWAFPLIIFIIGLHFLPLARLFRNPPHYVTGLLLVLLAVVYPQISVDGPSSPIGLLGAGLILWASALWAIAGRPFAATA